MAQALSGSHEDMVHTRKFIESVRKQVRAWTEGCDGLGRPDEPRARCTTFREGRRRWLYTPIRLVGAIGETGDGSENTPSNGGRYESSERKAGGREDYTGSEGAPFFLRRRTMWSLMFHGLSQACVVCGAHSYGAETKTQGLGFLRITSARVWSRSRDRR